MIVELCGHDLLMIVNGETVVIGDVIVREAKGDTSVVINGPAAPQRAVPASSAKGGSNNRRSFKSNRTGAAIITARFDSICRECQEASQGVAIGARIQKGSEIYYDYDNKKAYCMTHGATRFPNVKREEKVKS